VFGTRCADDNPAWAASPNVVCAASGAILEAALAGKRVVRVSPESHLDMDSLAWFAESNLPVSRIQFARS